MVVWTTTTLLIICPSSSIELNKGCSEKCGCSESAYAPICDTISFGSINYLTSLNFYEITDPQKSQTTYASPCHGGCRAYNFTNSPVCTCIPDQYEIVDGVCLPSCPEWKYWTFAVITFFCTGAGLFFVPLVPAAMMQSTTARLKGLQQALQIVLLRLIGALPGTIITGWLIDGACTLWIKDSDGADSSCFSYNNFSFALNLVVPGNRNTARKDKLVFFTL